MGARLVVEAAEVNPGEEIEDAYARFRQELLDDFREAHGPGEEVIYTGSMLDDDGTLDVRPDVLLPNGRAADAWFQEHAEKWGPTLAITVGTEESKRWYWGGLYAE